MSSSTLRTSGTTSRRGFLGAAGVTAATLASSSLLGGCGNDNGATGTVSDATSAKLPSYRPGTAIKADLPSKVDGAPSGFYNYPSDPEPSVDKAPLSGETLSVLGFLFGATPNPRAKNPAWQGMEKMLGGTVDFTAVPSDDYAAKLSTTIAGGDLPDVIFDDGSLPSKADFLAAKCQDLTSYLGGDAIDAYPNLAAIPTIFWEQGVTAGKLYELPIPRSIAAGAGIYNQTLFGKAGVDSAADIKDLDDFTSLLKELTNPGKNRWALGSTDFGLTNYLATFGVPNTWREDDGGELTHYYETDEYAAMVEFLAKVHKAGYFAPASEGWTKNQMVNAFNSARVALIYDGLPGYYGPSGYSNSLPKTTPGNVASPYIPFAKDGGKAKVWADNVTVSTTMIAKADEKKVRSILSLANLLAAPFGSKEFLAINFGAEGTDYKLDSSGNPVATSAATLDVGVPWRFVAAPPQSLYMVDDKETVKKTFDTYQEIVPDAVQNPCATLYSPTDSRKSSTISQPVSDIVTSIISGRKSMAELAPVVKRWRSQGGDTIREEYQKALAASK